MEFMKIEYILKKLDKRRERHQVCALHPSASIVSSSCFSLSAVAAVVEGN